MAYRVVWSPRALADVEAIAAYIASGFLYLREGRRQNNCHLDQIPGSFPRSGRKVPEFDDENTRELIAYSYWIIYTSRTGSSHHHRSDPRQANAVTSVPSPAAQG